MERSTARVLVAEPNGLQGSSPMAATKDGETTRPRARRRGGGHAGRLRRDAEARPSVPAYITREIPVYELLRDEELAKLEDQAEWILKEVGFTDFVVEDKREVLLEMVNDISCKLLGAELAIKLG